MPDIPRRRRDIDVQDSDGMREERQEVQLVSNRQGASWRSFNSEDEPGEGKGFQGSSLEAVAVT
jgi:hypothetical protein